MKKLSLFFALFCVILVATTSCDSNAGAKLKLKKSIEKAQKEFPSKYGEIFEVTSLEYDEDANEVIYKCIVYDDNSLVALENSKSTAQNMFTNAFTRNAEAKNILKLMDDAGASLKFVVTNSNRDKKIEFEISADDIKKGLDEGAKSQGDIARETVKANIEIYNKVCPTQIDEITVMTKVDLKDNNLTYYYDIDDSEGDIDELVSIDAMKEMLINDLRSNEATKKFIKQFVSPSGYGLSNIYHGTKSGKDLVITVSNDELRENI